MPQLIGLQGKDKIINIAEAISDQWRVVGIALLNDESGGVVKALAKEFRGNAQDINLEILQRWIQGKGISDCTWHGLLGVLRVHCGGLAESVEEALTRRPNKRPHLPLENPEAPSKKCKLSPSSFNATTQGYLAPTSVEEAKQGIVDVLNACCDKV